MGTLSGCSYLDKASNEAKSIAVEPAPNAGFIEQPFDGNGCQIIRTDIFQRALERAADGAAGGGDDDGFGHASSFPSR